MQKYVFYSDVQNILYLCTFETKGQTGMHRYALIGKRLGHSWSQRWFEAKFKSLGLSDCCYQLHEMASLDGLKQWVLHDAIQGFNVTVPYKQQIIPLLDELDTTASAIGAVNCVTVEGGRLVGHNTDAEAFLWSLQHTGWVFRQAFVLGTGGAARAVAFALRQLQVPHLFVSRTPHGNDQIGYRELSSAISLQPTLIVNATPVGMYPNVDETPLDLSSFNVHLSSFCLYDLTYNPSPTRLMRDAASLGASVKDGLEMLHRQADLSWSLFSHE